MATDIDILRSNTPTQTKRMKVRITSQENLAFQGAGQCGVVCYTCESEKLTGACVLEASHSGNHKCNNGHQWAARPGIDIPGPHQEPA